MTTEREVLARNVKVRAGQRGSVMRLLAQAEAAWLLNHLTRLI